MIFGEYIPFYEQHPLVHRTSSPRRRTSAAASDPAVVPARRYAGHDFKLGPLICYEDILPVVRAPAWRRCGPNLFVNITNDAWFGRTAEPYQHLALAVFRSVEHRLEMVRAVNTGVSAHIDAAGRVLQATATVDPLAEPPPTPATLLADAALLEGGGLYRTSAICSGSCAWRAGGLCCCARGAPRRRMRPPRRALSGARRRGK